MRHIQAGNLKNGAILIFAQRLFSNKKNIIWNGMGHKSLKLAVGKCDFCTIFYCWGKDLMLTKLSHYFRLLTKI